MTESSRSRGGGSQLGVALAIAVVACACSSAPGASTDAAPACPPKTSPASLPGQPASDALTAVTSFGENPGGLEMFVHVPANLPKGAAVVVAMHGCTQSASAYVAAGWNELADKAGFLVVYPQQTSANDFTQCFRWWDTAQITRGQGEAASIANMVAYARSTYGSGDAFVTGLSAGGAMTAVMLAAYPDVFHAGAVMSGIAYKCATQKLDAYQCMAGKDQTAEAWGALLPELARSSAPRVSIWQGDADYTVQKANATALVRQWTNANGVSDTPTKTETVGEATHEVFGGAGGAARVESWIIAGMSHGVALDPKNGCGTAGAFLLDEGLCSTVKAAAFFGLVDDSGAPAPGGSSAAPPSSPGPAHGDCD